MNFRLIIKMFILFAGFILIPSFAVSRVIQTKHNLSISGIGNIKATEEAQICIFCHTPHNARPEYPLWNHDVSAVQTYKTYWSNTLNSYSNAASQEWRVDGFSRLCLGCHDGTVAVGAVNNCSQEDIEVFSFSGSVDGAGRLLPTAPGYLGTDLSGGHPISIKYDDTLVAQRNMNTNSCQLNPPPSPLIEPDVRLYPTQGDKLGVQCTSCHDPHGGKGGPEAPPFWRKPEFSDVCEVCHVAGCTADFAW